MKPQTQPRAPVFRPDLRSILAGFAVMFGIDLAFVLALGVVRSVPVFLVSGLVAGLATGWLTIGGTRTTRLSSAVLVGVLHAAVSASLGGVLVYLFLLLDPGGVRADLIAAWGGVFLLLVASPLAIVFFGLKGIVGGAVGAASRLIADRGFSVVGPGYER